MDETQKKAATERRMQELNPTSEAFRQWARAMRGYVGASRSRASIERARLKTVNETPAPWADELLNQLAKRTAQLQCLGVKRRREMLNGVQPAAT